jgi:hypothetical protein
MELCEELILELTALVMKANKVTKHHFFVNFSGHVNSIEVSYLENGYIKDARNNIKLLDLYIDKDENNTLRELLKCKHVIKALIEGSEDNGKLSDIMQSQGIKR